MTKKPEPPVSLKDHLVNGAFRALLGLLSLLPYERRVAVAGWAVSRLVAPLAGWRRRIRENLALTCPDLPRAEVERLVRAVPNNVGRNMVELYAGAEFISRAESLPLAGPGLPALEAARREGRAAVLVSGHFGSYNAPRVALTAQGFRLGGLFRRMKNPLFNTHYTEAMESISLPIFERGKRGMAEMMRFLKGGGMVAILMDQHMRHGAEVTFFGQRARTATSAADLALRYKVDLIPIYGIRAPDGVSFQVIVDAPIPHGTPEAMTQAINDSLERQVRAHMDQWFWIHRRWK